MFNTLIFQAEATQLNIGGWRVNAEQVGVLNPIFDLFLIPFTEFFLYPTILRRFPRFNPLHKMTVGMVAASCSFACATLLQAYIHASPVHSVSIAWQIPQYFLISVAEIFVSIPILDFGYSQAPREMKGVVQAFVWFTIGVGTCWITNKCSLLLLSVLMFMR